MIYFSIEWLVHRIVNLLGNVRLIIGVNSHAHFDWLSNNGDVDEDNYRTAGTFLLLDICGLSPKEIWN